MVKFQSSENINALLEWITILEQKETILTKLTKISPKVIKNILS